MKRQTPLAWPRIIAGSLQEDRVRQQLLARWSAAPETPAVGEDGAYYGLRRVARELGVSRLTRMAYDACRDELVAADARKAVSLDLGVLLPTSEQISSKLGGWRSALEWAGLSAGRQDEASGADEVPVRVEKRSMPHVTAAVLFAETNGRLPAYGELLGFMRDCEMGLQDLPSGTRWTECQKQAEAELVARHPGREFARPKHGGHRRGAGRPRGHNYALPAETTLAALRDTFAARKGTPAASKWDRAAVLAALAAYAACLRPGQDGRQKHYQSLAFKRGWPSVKNISKYGRFQALLAEARRAALPPDRPPSSGHHR